MNEQTSIFEEPICIHCETTMRWHKETIHPEIEGWWECLECGYVIV